MPFQLSRSAWSNLAQDAALDGFALGDFAASCLKRREAGGYANAWGIKLQEVLTPRPDQVGILRRGVNQAGCSTPELAWPLPGSTYTGMQAAPLFCRASR
ncbi:unnamed protein product [Symbiodinium sp. CCMP2592]|nr:unnamed protein product [Symbiodinium sp. CCMP2592]